MDDDLASILQNLDSVSLPIKWNKTNDPVAQSSVLNGICNLWYNTNKAGDNPDIGSLLEACIRQGGLAKHEDMSPDAKWLTWYNNLSNDALWKLQAITQGQYHGKGAVLHGIMWPSQDNYNIATDGNRPVGHEIKHIYDGKFHN